MLSREDSDLLAKTATMLADLGADVIKVEPPDGDPYRHRTGGPGVPESPYNYRWIVDNRTKRGLALDLRRPEGRERLLASRTVVQGSASARDEARDTAPGASPPTAPS